MVGVPVRPVLLLLICPALASACVGETPNPSVTPSVPDEGFTTAQSVRILSPATNDWVGEQVDLSWRAGSAVSGLRLEVEGTTVEEITSLGEGRRGTTQVQLDAVSRTRVTLRLVGLDEGGAEVSAHTVKVYRDDEALFVGLASPSDGAAVPNPVRFVANAGSAVDTVEFFADDWSLGSAEPGELLTYTFSGTGFPRRIDVLAYADGEVVASDTATITVLEGNDIPSSSFNELVADFLEEYPTDGSYEYWWPSGSDWGGNPHDIYYLGALFAAGDPQNRSFCVGLTFEVFMRAFHALDHVWGGDGSLNGIAFAELYEFRTDWYVRDLYGTGVVEAMDNYGIGHRVTDWEDAQLGDFLQFWRHDGSGHNVVFVDWERDAADAIIGFSYWSTQGSTDGVGVGTEYFGATGSAVDPAYVFLGRVAEPTLWWPWI